MSGLFEALIAPTSVEAFLRDHWDRRALFAKADAATRDARLAALGLSPATLRAVAARAPAGSVWASYNDERGRPVSTIIDGAAVDYYRHARQTIFVRNLQALHAPTQLFVAAIQSAIGYPAKVDAVSFWSPPSTGFGFHFDCKNALTLQLAGKKRWRHQRAAAITAPPVEPFRQAHPWAQMAPLDENELVESVLEPGDVLFLPAGTWHSVAAADDEESLSIAIGFVPRPMHQLVTGWLDDQLKKLDPWRRTPLLHAPAPLDAAAGLASLRSLVAELTEERLHALAGARDAMPPTGE
ncbi:MAG TPA: cupin domain-containing protein [Polyangia bacterium]|nr:cupin domain-containing protein [Polyangia bacterium]